MGYRNSARQTVGARGKGGYHVQPEKGEIGEVLPVERLVFQVRMDETDAAKTLAPEPVFRKVGDENAVRCPDEDVSHAAAAVDDEANLPADAR